MTRRKRDPLRKLSEEERNWLERISRSQSEPASHVIRAKQLLAVAEGHTYTEAAELAGIKSGDTTSSLVRRFNQDGLEALQPRHGGGFGVKYGLSERERILKEFRRKPVPEIDGTATWSLKTLRAALHKAPDGLPEVSEDTIRTVLLEHGYSWQQSRSWCETGTAVRKRKRGKVIVTDPDTVAKKTSSNWPIRPLRRRVWRSGIKMKPDLTRLGLTQARVGNQKVIQPCSRMNMCAMGSPRF